MSVKQPAKRHFEVLLCDTCALAQRHSGHAQCRNQNRPHDDNLHAPDFVQDVAKQPASNPDLRVLNALLQDVPSRSFFVALSGACKLSVTQACVVSAAASQGRVQTRNSEFGVAFTLRSIAEVMGKAWLVQTETAAMQTELPASST